MVYKETFIKYNKDDKFFLREWLPESSCNSNIAAIILHGLGGNSLYYNKICAILANKGIAIYAYDRRGHGKSFGRKGYDGFGSVDTNDLSCVVDHLSQINNYKKIYIIGDSWGCLVGLQYLHENKTNIGGLIMLSPPISIPVNTRWIKPFFKSMSHFLVSGKMGPIFPLQDASNSKEFFLYWILMITQYIIFL